MSSSFDYLKKLIYKHGYTLQYVADASGITKSYLKQLINSKIKNPNTKNLESLHRFLGLEFPYYEKSIGIVFGKFYPLHTGHIYLVQRSYSQVNELHIIMGYDKLRDNELFKNSSMLQQPTVNDRLRWLLQTFKYQKNIYIHSFNEKGIEPYPNGWHSWSIAIKKFLIKKGIKANYVYTSEISDAPMYFQYLGIPAIVIDSNRLFINISASQIRKNPSYYWEYIPNGVKPFFVRTVLILGSESTGKSILVNKLSNLFNTTSAWEYRKKYIFSQLNSNKITLQYSDYDKITLGQANYIDNAIRYANKVTFIDTDFINLQALCIKNEGCKHPFIQAFINKYRFDLVILLEANKNFWIQRNKYTLDYFMKCIDFQSILVALLHENNINFVCVIEENYDALFLRCVKLVKNMLSK